MSKIISVQYSIDNQFTDCFLWNLWNVLSVESFDFCTNIYMLKNKIVGVFYLLINRTFKFLSVNKENFVRSFENSALYARKMQVILSKKPVRNRRNKMIFFLLEQPPAYKIFLRPKAQVSLFFH